MVGACCVLELVCSTVCKFAASLEQCCLGSWMLAVAVLVEMPLICGWILITEVCGGVCWVSSCFEILWSLCAHLSCLCYCSAELLVPWQGWTRCFDCDVVYCSVAWLIFRLAGCLHDFQLGGCANSCTAGMSFLWASSSAPENPKETLSGTNQAIVQGRIPKPWSSLVPGVSLCGWMPGVLLEALLSSRQRNVCLGKQSSGGVYLSKGVLCSGREWWEGIKATGLTCYQNIWMIKKSL